MNGTSDTSRSIVDGVRKRLMDDWQILQHVFNLVQQKETLCADPELWQHQKIVDFKQPNELKVSGRSPPSSRTKSRRLVTSSVTDSDKKLLQEFTMQP